MEHFAIGTQIWTGLEDSSVRCRDDDLQKEIAPGKNRLIYIWGHLSATSDRMIPLLGFGERRYPELDLIFISQPDRAVPQTFAGQAMGDIWSELGDLLWSEFAKLTPAEWLDRHQAVSPEDFEREPHRNRYAIVLGRTTHLAYHLGQAILVNANNSKVIRLAVSEQGISRAVDFGHCRVLATARSIYVAEGVSADG